MKEAWDRRGFEPAGWASDPGSGGGRVLSGGLTAAIGALMAVAMAVAMVHEIVMDDFFGASVSGMVVVFGAELVKIGYRAMTGARRKPPEPSELDRLWESETPVRPYRPYSQLDIRGR